ncbi:probable pancreatic secretory proteinase inhibitor isoform X2 [Perca fluviatilis]|uniref:probable pancreatic secretory proteinase inhibitor isoform X2 n=1 Tax=Perca fluviatilis TaxID=8168 RepID=UPI0019636073|nr:probable pancreatic secretory proteinase inhibitor isoform X2 [Perca fluviatilis]
MFGRTLLLVSVAVFFCADAEDKSRLYRRPSCVGTSVSQACPLTCLSLYLSVSLTCLSLYLSVCSPPVWGPVCLRFVF